MADWKLIEAEDIDATLDDSGLYVVISREESYPEGDYLLPRIRVRADLLSTAPTGGDIPLVSFIGSANNVRKNLVRWIDTELIAARQPSPEHFSYLGYELLRAEKEVGFVQD